MKKILLLFAFVLTSCFEQQRNVADFKTGTFEFEQTIDGKKHVSTFKRTTNLQIETYENKTDTARVRWVSDSEFVLEKLHPKSMKDQKAISIKILSTTKTGYTFEYAFVGEEKKQQGFAKKIIQ